MTSHRVDPNALSTISSQFVQFVPPGISETREQLFDKVDGSILIAMNLIEILRKAIHAQEAILALDPLAPDYKASLADLLSNSPSRELLSEHVDVAFSNAIKLRDIMEQLLEEKTSQSTIPPAVGRTSEESEAVKQQREDLQKRLAEYLSEDKPLPKLTQTETELARASQQEIRDLLRTRVDKLNKLIKKAINLVNILRAIDKKQMEHFGAKDEKELRYILEHGGRNDEAESKPSSQSDLHTTTKLNSNEVKNADAKNSMVNASNEPAPRVSFKAPENAESAPRVSFKAPENEDQEWAMFTASAKRNREEPNKKQRTSPAGEPGRTSIVEHPFSGEKIKKVLTNEDEERFYALARRISKKSLSNPFGLDKRKSSTPRQRISQPVFDPLSRYANPNRSNSNTNSVPYNNATIVDDFKESIDYDNNLKTFVELLSGEKGITEAPGHALVIATMVIMGLGLGFGLYSGLGNKPNPQPLSLAVLSADIQKCIIR